ncbi:hypothetical protein [Lacinutrix sp. Bg11-31]|uniref:hypothetical protein n=1 Tax=Lacinutrix sp. Bg11-31 TaxID=2057808 RepID=UPI000C302148|nr:hypothetical protein [Lacinutrix sp. Bg11-31]AUC81619.1 hypothetical protein CW733_05525 [Lacinutrix sp. Bg11-31]
MKNILFILTIVSILFLGCDGKDRVYKSNTDVLKEHKLLDSFSEDIKYFPEKYNEFKIDTILSNGFTVKIKSYTDMESSYLNEFKADNITHKHFYRDSKATIVVTNNGIVFDKLIDKKTFSEFDNTFSELLKDTNMNGVWINEEKSLLNSNITINVNFCKPETDQCEFFNLIIEKDGKYRIIRIIDEVEKKI